MIIIKESVGDIKLCKFIMYITSEDHSSATTLTGNNWISMDEKYN